MTASRSSWGNSLSVALTTALVIFSGYGMWDAGDAGVIVSVERGWKAGSLESRRLGGHGGHTQSEWRGNAERG